MRALLIPLVALCSLGVSGCHVAYSAHPLNNSEDAVEEPSLAGHWTSPDSKEDDFCILKGDKNTYTLILADSKSGDDGNAATDAKSEKPTTLVETFQITLVRLEDQLFADMVPDQMAVDGEKIEPPVGSVYHHIVLKLDLTGSDLAYSVLSDSAVREANEQGYAPLPYVEINDGILLTASTDELRWSVSHYADRLFGDSSHYTRVIDNADSSTPSPCSAFPPSGSNSETPK